MGVKKNKKNMRIAVDFLKRTNLFSFWMKYVYQEQDKRFKHRHWSDMRDIVQVFGQTKFTSFVNQQIDRELPCCVYELFEAYLNHLGLLNHSSAYAKNHLIFKENKKISILLSDGTEWNS